jgi:hypothetical protein
MSHIAVRIEGVSKAYRLGVRNDTLDTLVEAALAGPRTPFSQSLPKGCGRGST